MTGSPAPSVPARPLGALLLFALFFGVVLYLLNMPLSAECDSLLAADPMQYADVECGPRFDARMSWLYLWAIPAIVSGCATVTRWPRYRRSTVTGNLE